MNTDITADFTNPAANATTTEICYREVGSERILNPTSIDLGEYVINPYMGCAFNCLYCYVRSNRAVSRRRLAWGQFVDIRIDAPRLLSKELTLKKPKNVLLGSTTECFQPIEEKYGLTQALLKILNKQGIYYIILTRSPLIVSALPLLKAGYCQRIYFTINNYSPAFKARLEPGSPAFADRAAAIHTLTAAGLTVIPYFSPVLPGISDLNGIFEDYPDAGNLECECLNFRLANLEAIIAAIGSVDSGLQALYRQMQHDAACYYRVWTELQCKLTVLAQNRQERDGKPLPRYQVHVHQFGDYFKNTYNKP
jgi:DNA repair photolyase